MPRININTGELAILRRDWFDQSRTVQQECNTLQPGCVVALSDGTIVYNAGSNTVVGGGAVWALLTLEAVVVTSTNLSFAGADVATVGPDGAIAIKDVRNSYGPWHIHELIGTNWLLTSGDAYDIQLLGYGKAIWREAPSTDLHQTAGLGLVTPQGEWGWPRVTFIHSAVEPYDTVAKLLYQSYSHGCLVFDGHIVAYGTTFFYPDVLYRDGFIHIAWSLDQADTQVVEKFLSLDELAQLPLVPVTPPTPIPPDPPIPPEPTPVPPDPGPTPIPPFPKPDIGTARGYKMSDTKLVGLIALDGKYISFDKKGNVVLDNVEVSESGKFEMSKPDDRFQFVHALTRSYLGADATQYSNDICKQLYLITERGVYESWVVEHPAPPNNDLTGAYVIHRRPEGINFTIHLRVVEL